MFSNSLYRGKIPLSPKRENSYVQKEMKLIYVISFEKDVGSWKQVRREPGSSHHLGTQGRAQWHKEKGTERLLSKCCALHNFL